MPSSHVLRDIVDDKDETMDFDDFLNRKSYHSGPIGVQSMVFMLLFTSRTKLCGTLARRPWYHGKCTRMEQKAIVRDWTCPLGTLALY